MNNTIDLIIFGPDGRAQHAIQEATLEECRTAWDRLPAGKSARWKRFMLTNRIAELERQEEIETLRHARR